MNKLGFGLMRLPLRSPDDRAAVDMDETVRMVDRFLAGGGTYFDTAWSYHDFNSENIFREAVTERYPREAYNAATKLHCWFVNDKSDCDRIFFEQLKKTGLEYFDNYLLHDANVSFLEKYEALDCFDWLIEKKEQGLVRNIGISIHDSVAVVDSILTRHPELDFVQLQINYLDWNSQGIQSKACYEACVRHGKQVIVMEPVKGGLLAQLPPEAEHELKKLSRDKSPASYALRFAASLENVTTVLSGMSSISMVEDNIAALDGDVRLSKAESAAIERVIGILSRRDAIPCTGCSYCTDVCPSDILIPRYIYLYNKDMREIENKAWSSQFEKYFELAECFGRASQCIMCGKCEGICPQHLPIRSYMKEIAAYFERPAAHNSSPDVF